MESHQQKIIHIIDSLDFGGAQTVVKGIFEQDHSNDIFLLALRKTERIIAISHPNITLYNSSSKYSFLPLLKIRQIIRREKIDILHCHLFRSQVFGWLIKTFCCSKIKLVFHEHGGIFGSEHIGLGGILEHKLYVLSLNIMKRKVDKFIAVSRATKVNLINKINCNDDGISILYNFIDLNKYKKKETNVAMDSEKKRLGIKNGEFVVGFAGRLVLRKGWKKFIEASRLLKDYNIKFLVAGDGQDKYNLLQLIKDYELEDSVIYIGYISDIIWFYNLLDCFVIPSYWEGLPMAQLEVMACGLPLITSDAPGMNEIPRNNLEALYVSKESSVDLAEKIYTLSQNKGLQGNLGKNSLNRVKEYSIDNYLKKLNAFYHTM